MAVDALQTLETIQFLTGIYLVVVFGITIYQVFLNRKQAKVHEQMIELTAEVVSIKKLLESKLK